MVGWSLKHRSGQTSRYLFAYHPPINFDQISKSAVGLVEEVVGCFLCDESIEVVNIPTLVGFFGDTGVKVIKAV
jgi:hypothetical protein